PDYEVRHLEQAMELLSLEGNYQAIDLDRLIMYLHEDEMMEKENVVEEGYLLPYKLGDVVRLFYPYVPKVRQTEIEEQVARYENEKQPVFFEGKNRYGVVVGVPNNHSDSLSVVQIMSHGDVTNSKEYRLRDDELKVPSHIYVPHSGEERELTGVVKMERIEH